MVEDIRSSLNYNYKITAQKFRDTGINAERFGTAQNLYDNTERNIKTLQDLIAIIRALKKDHRFDLVDSYSENKVTTISTLMKILMIIRALTSAAY